MSPTPLSDFVNTYDDHEHEDSSWDDFVYNPFDNIDEDEIEVVDDDWDYDAHEGMSREDWEDWLENGP